MTDATYRLKAMRVGHVMSQTPVQLSANASMTEAADILLEHGISTAPVMDDQGRCIGILSSTDFLRRQSSLGHANESSMSNEVHQVVEPGAGQPIYISPVVEDRVSYHMTRAVQSVKPDVSLLKAAHIMNAEHIHRLPVLDDDDRVVGMLSTMDIVSSLIGAVDEESKSFVRQMRDGDF